MTMNADPAQIAAQRKHKRENTQMEHRTTAALEEISDTLEAIRVILLSMTSAMNTRKR